MYAQYFDDWLQSLAGVLTDTAPEDGGVVVSGADLVSGRSLGRLFGMFAEERDIAEHRAVATEWSKFFFARLLIPAIVVQVRSAGKLDLSPGRWRAYCRTDGTVSCFVFDRDPLVETETPGDMASLIDDVMTPLISTLAANSGLSPRVFASNAAMYYGWILDQFESEGYASNAALDRARALLHNSSRSDSGLNPFYAPCKSLPAGARDGNGEPVTQCRRLCCVRDLDPALPLCPNCPRAIMLADAADMAGAS